MRSRPVSFETTDGLRLHGVYYDVGGTRTVVHVHGKCGNFYENGFISALAEVYGRVGVNTMTFNNRGATCISEGYRHGALVYVGGSLERFHDCVWDIGAATEMARSLGAETIVLQGHSHGCEKTVYYAQRRTDVDALILLSPADSYALHERYIAPESISEQIARLQRAEESMDDVVLLPAKEYGVSGDAVRYSVPITQQALMSWITSPEVQLFHSDDVHLFVRLDIPAIVYIGVRDSLQLGAGNRTMRCVAARIESPRFALSNQGDHHLSLVEERLGEEIADWLCALA